MKRPAQPKAAPKPPAKPAPKFEREFHSYDWRTRQNLKQNQGR